MAFFFEAFIGLLTVGAGALSAGIAGLTLSTIGGLLIGGAVLFGVAALTKSLAKTRAADAGTIAASSGGYSQQPTPQDIQQTVRQAVPPRRRHYGRVKTGGYVAFFNSLSGTFYQLLLVGQGRQSSFEEHWLNDQQVLLGAAPSVALTPFGSKTGVASASYGFIFGTAAAIQHATIYPTTLLAPGNQARIGYASTALRVADTDGVHRGNETFVPFAGSMTAKLYGQVGVSPEVLLATITFTNSLAPQFLNSTDSSTLYNRGRVEVTPGSGWDNGNSGYYPNNTKVGIEDLEFTFTADSIGNSVVSTISGGGLLEDPFTTTSASAVVNVYHPAHGFETGATLAFFGLTDAVNGIPVAELEEDRGITVVDDDNYTVMADTPATASGDGGGAEVRWRKTNSGAANPYLYDNIYRANIYPLLGEDEQAASKVLIDAFPTAWGVDHRLSGIANVLCTFQDVPQADFGAVYPQGIPQYRAVLAGALVYDPRDVEQQEDDPTTWSWSDNPAREALDFLTHADGMGRPRSMFDLDSFSAAADVCDETVLLKNGGVEARYRCNVSYDLTEQPAAVLQRILATCDGHLYPTPEGKWGLRVGKWYAPTAIIENAAVLEYSIEQGSDALTKFNQLKVTYTDPLNDYQETEAEPWEDAASIAAYGTISDQLRVLECPSPSQARRLAKIAFAKGNPSWRGTVKTILAGLVAFGEAVARVKLDELEIDEDFLVTSFQIAGDLSYCLMEISALSSATYDWDPDAEEGTRPATPLTSVPLQVPDVPVGFLVLAGQILIQGSTFGAAAAASWDPPARTSLSHEIHYKLTSAEEHDWVAVNLIPGAESWISGVLSDGTSYDFRLRAIGPGGAPSAWTAEQVVVMTADITAPGPPTGLSSALVGTTITVTWTNPTSSNFYKTVDYRGTTAVFGAAVTIETHFGGNGRTKQHVDAGMAPGTYYYWVKAFNASGIGSAEVGPTSQTVV